MHEKRAFYQAVNYHIRPEIICQDEALVKMEYQKTEGIILHLIPYRDAHQIVILFTEDAGLIKIMCYGSLSQKSKWRGICRALTQVEVVYREKQGEIFECKDLTLINSYDTLRQNYNQMEAACDLLYALNQSQLPGRVSPKLYALMIYYLGKIPTIKDPWILSLSFRLKLLRHDGVLDYPFMCHECGEPLLCEAYYAQHEIFCAQHACAHACFFKQEDLQLIYLLTACQSYNDLITVQLPTDFKMKVFTFFEDCLRGG